MNNVNFAWQVFQYACERDGIAEWVRLTHKAWELRSLQKRPTKLPRNRYHHSTALTVGLIHTSRIRNCVLEEYDEQIGWRHTVAWFEVIKHNKRRQSEVSNGNATHLMKASYSEVLQSQDDSKLSGSSKILQSEPCRHSKNFTVCLEWKSVSSVLCCMVLKNLQRALPENCL